MKRSTVILVILSLLEQGALAFAPPATSFRPSAATSLRAEKRGGGDGVAAVASALLVGLSVSTHAAFANEIAFNPQLQSQASSVASSSGTMAVAEIDQFTLPSYDSSKGSSLIDLSSEVETVNKRTIAQAKARREYVDTSVEKMEADELRRAEKDGSSLLEDMLGSADKDRKATIEAEKAETRANRWKTF